MTKLDHALEVTTNEASQPKTKRKYGAPEIRVAGSAVDLVQGCGGSSGQDRNAYRIFCQ